MFPYRKGAVVASAQLRVQRVEKAQQSASVNTEVRLHRVRDDPCKCRDERTEDQESGTGGNDEPGGGSDGKDAASSIPGAASAAAQRSG
jgi:hypothetical protein